jgi:phosphotransferase system  glucose/maltose/N-acetylglucosamine-specific IIC component
MAEIHVQAKKKTGTLWFWIVLFLLVIAAIVVYVMFRDGTLDQKNSNQPTQTSFIQHKEKQEALYLCM